SGTGSPSTWPCRNWSRRSRSSGSAARRRSRARCATARPSRSMSSGPWTSASAAPIAAYAEGRALRWLALGQTRRLARGGREDDRVVVDLVRDERQPLLPGPRVERELDLCEIVPPHGHVAVLADLALESLRRERGEDPIG